MIAVRDAAISDWVQGDLEEVSAVIASRPAENWNDLTPPGEPFCKVARIGERIEAVLIAHYVSDVIFADTLECRYENGSPTENGAHALEALKDWLRDRSKELQRDVVCLTYIKNVRFMEALARRSFAPIAVAYRRPWNAPERSRLAKEDDDGREG
jgi:hypothetical protein